MGRKSLFELIHNASKEKIDYANEFLIDLEYHIKKLEKDSQKEISKTFKPSSIKCQRCAVMQVLSAPKNKEIRSSNMIGITSAGSFIHEMIQSKVVSMPNWEYVDVVEYVEANEDLHVLVPCDFENGVYETKLHSDMWNMNFLVDGILRKNRKYIILEIKSISSRGFFKTKEVPDKYKDQAISYCNLLGIDDVLFLFVDRDLFNMRTFLYTPTENEKINWKNMMNQNLKFVHDNIIPAKPEYADKSFCQYCSYSEYCSSIGCDAYEFGKEL